MVRIVDAEPHKSVVKEVICRNCGATLEYVPQDIESRIYSDYGGGKDNFKHIRCPKCSEEVGVS